MVLPDGESAAPYFAFSGGGFFIKSELSEQAERLCKWAHMLGSGGHFLTKSRRYSITFRILSENRVATLTYTDPAGVRPVTHCWPTHPPRWPANGRTSAA